ncbi:hypothetical protein Ahy_B06g085838 isoform B [Arachis hypogaea]|uniref:Pollen-specific protein n=1 Tax=Arachis hypogaea TaxID=3818 RepID=A0A444YVS5_ARAHY|nr:hypothetical protein Ahy_B06g085838 isoform B [Arachis hypogaea]
MQMKMREREMAASTDSVSVDIDAFSPPPKEHIVRTHYGYVSVAVYGDPEKPALITYPDLALNYVSCFQGLLFCPEASTLLLHNFCIYHISPPGHEVCSFISLSHIAVLLDVYLLTVINSFIGNILSSCFLIILYFVQELPQLGAPEIAPDYPVLSVDDLADQIAEVLNFFGLSAVMCMGVAAGAYILTLFAMKYRQRVLGLILVSPLCKEPSWTEWLCNKDIRGGAQFPESDIVKACRRSLDEMHSLNVWRFLEAINGRPDLSEGLRKLNCRSLIFVGDMSPFHSEALHITSKLDRRFSALVEVQACGSIVTEEQPHAMLIPIEYFLMGYGLYRQSKSLSPRSPLSPSWISPELFTPESMGLKLKPIKTRIPT